MNEHALVKIGDYMIPLVGIPYEACLMNCDLCHVSFYLTDVKLNYDGNQFHCMFCRNERIDYVGKYPLYIDAE